MDLYEAITLSQQQAVLDAVKLGVDLNAPDNEGRLPILGALEAAKDGDVQMIGLLLDHGVKLNPLVSALKIRFDKLKAELLEDHNATVKCINGAVTALQKINIKSLDDQEKARTSKFLLDSQAFAERSEELRAGVLKLCASLEGGDRKSAEDAAALLNPIKMWQIRGMFIRAESLMIEQM